MAIRHKVQQCTSSPDLHKISFTCKAGRIPFTVRGRLFLHKITCRIAQTERQSAKCGNVSRKFRGEKFLWFLFQQFTCRRSSVWELCTCWCNEYRFMLVIFSPHCLNLLSFERGGLIPTLLIPSCSINSSERGFLRIHVEKNHKFVWHKRSIGLAQSWDNFG